MDDKESMNDQYVQSQTHYASKKTQQQQKALKLWKNKRKASSYIKNTF